MSGECGKEFIDLSLLLFFFFLFALRFILLTYLNLDNRLVVGNNTIADENRHKHKHAKPDNSAIECFPYVRWVPHQAGKNNTGCGIPENRKVKLMSNFSPTASLKLAVWLKAGGMA